MTGTIGGHLMYYSFEWLGYGLEIRGRGLSVLLEGEEAEEVYEEIEDAEDASEIQYILAQSVAVYA